MGPRGRRLRVAAGAAALLALTGPAAGAAQRREPAAAGVSQPPPVAAAASPRIDPAYSALLIDGALAYDRRDYAGAARLLRLACFGHLEDPPALAGCLVRLGAAQAAAGDAAGFVETFGRVIDVEQRFGAYGRAAVPPEIRAAFEERVAAVIPTATLAAVPAFAPLAERKQAARQSALTPKERRALEKQRKREEEAARRSGRNAAAEPPPGRQAAANPATPAGNPPAAGSGGGEAAAPPPAPAPGPITDEERAVMEQARRLLVSNSQADIRQALRLARQVADAHPDSREAQHLAGEAAYRSARWQDAATYFRRGGDPGDTQPELLFYLAVALFESGDREGAAAVLERSLPNLERTPYVDAYARRILRNGNGG